MKPKVSVVMPVYKAKMTVANAINSIRNQTMKDWELVSVMDGKDEETEKIIRSFKDERIKIVNIEHSGLVTARNTGNQHASAEVIAIQDADDLSMPDRLEKCLKEIERGADVVIHDAYVNLWDPEFQCITRGYIKNPTHLPMKDLIVMNQCFTGWPVFRKSVWEQKPFRLETEFCYDWSMHIDWILSGFKYKIINEGLYEYVRIENSASQVFEKDGRREESIRKIKEIIKEYAKN